MVACEVAPWFITISMSLGGLGAVMFFAWAVFDTYKDKSYNRETAVYDKLKGEISDLQWQVDYLKHIDH